MLPLATVALTFALATSAALAEDVMQIESENDGMGNPTRLVARNVGSSIISVLGGRFNGRADCELVPARYAYEQAAFYTIAALDRGLEDESARDDRSMVQGLDVEPGSFELMPGEALELYYSGSPCTSGGAEIVGIEIYTEGGVITFSSN